MTSGVRPRLVEQSFLESSGCQEDWKLSDRWRKL